MAASTKSYVKYELSGTARNQFPFEFPYFNVSDITVELPPDYTGTYTINASTNTVELSYPISIGTVLIRRHTAQAVKHIFANMMRFNFKTVDENFKQCLYWFQEALDSIDFLSASAIATRIDEVEAAAAGWVAAEAAARNTAISNERVAWQQGDASLAQQITTTLAASTGAGLVGFLQSGVGAVKRTILDKLLGVPVSPKDFGGVGDGVAYDAAAINAAAAYCAANGLALDLRGAASWRINGRIVLTGVPEILVAFSVPIMVDVSGAYANGWAVEVGNPAVGPFDGRSTTSVTGGLAVFASSRASALGGVYMKGSWMNIGHIRAVGFNGCGIFQDSVWDSTTSRLSVELCGNVSTYSLRLASNGDTHNTSHIGSIQCEQAYHKGIYIDVLRDVIDNIHAERLAVLSVSDGASTDGYLNHSITATNSTIHQAIMDCLTSGTAPDGSTLAATTLHVLMNLAGATITNTGVAGTIYRTYGSGAVFVDVSGVNVIESGASGKATYLGCSFSGTFSPYANVLAENTTVGTLSPTYGASNVVMVGGAIAAISFANNVSGNITVRDAAIGTVLGTRNPAAGFFPVTLENCVITMLTGAYNDEITVRGGYVATASLASQSHVICENVVFGAFAYTGNTGFVTRGCRGPAGSTWATPGYISYAAGTVTERVGYNSAGKIYQNTDGGTTWAKLI